MKKKYLIFYPLIGIFLLLYGCCHCEKTPNEGNVIKGIITSFGNEPFVEIGIKTEDNKNYQFICSKELKQELMKKQGQLYAIHYFELVEESGIQKLVVEKVIQIIKK